MKNTGSPSIVVGLLLALLLLDVSGAEAAEPSMADYTHYPIFQANAVPPNILIMLDNSGSMNLQAYTGEYDHNTRYYGYFEPYQRYKYSANPSNVFTRDAAGPWDGNFLNWLTMRRIDIARRVLMGGTATSRMGSGNTTLYGEDPAQAGRDFIKSFTDTLGLTPYSGMGAYDYHVDDGDFEVNATTYRIRVKKDSAYPDEAPYFVDGNIVGVFQRVGDKARWGNEWFNFGTGDRRNGGRIANTVGGNLTNMITDMQNTRCDTWTPLAEAFYVAMQYFKQEDVAAELASLYPNNAIPNANIGQDPYYNGEELVSCSKSFVILLTDGASTMDNMIPSFLKDYDEDGHDPGVYSDSGSDYLDDVALYVRTNDLRADLEGEQNLLLYAIYAFGNEAGARQLLQDAARNGGFEDRNGNDRPDLDAEWDADADGDPDTYYEAQDGYALEAQLLAAINDILKRAASGTAVSVLATQGNGEGSLIQAYFRPTMSVGTSEVRWVGYLQSLWVDCQGNMREDTNGNLRLDVDQDKILKFFIDDSGDTVVKVYDVSADTPYPDLEAAPFATLPMDGISPTWEAGSLLHARNADTRKVFTFVDKDNDDVADEAGLGQDPFDAAGEVVAFSVDSASSVKPFLGVAAANWDYLGATHDDRARNLIEYVRGKEGDELAGSVSVRAREIDDVTWKLGDIIHSTPASVSMPPDRFDLIYGDASYYEFLMHFNRRETMVYVGANDGMLHAFTSWIYDREAGAYVQPAETTDACGDEIWAYIPETLLPHLKWLADRNYTHVDYIDLKPKLLDAKIFPDDTHYTDDDSDPNWGTILLCGLNMGGKHIQATDDFAYDGSPPYQTRSFDPCYFAIDVTDPRSPRLMWERSYQQLNLTTSFPAVIRVKDKWMAVFGSGPTDYEGASKTSAHLFVVDLATGEPYRNAASNDWLFTGAEANAHFSGPVSLDKNLNFNVDAVYVGETYVQGASSKGRVYKVFIPAVSGGAYDDTDPDNYVDNPLDASHPWQMVPLFSSPAPITAPLALSVDKRDNLWVYGGTGRYMSQADKTTTDQQYLFGIKDPFYNKDLHGAGAPIYYHNYSSNLALTAANLFDTSGFTVRLDRTVYDGGGALFGTFHNLRTAIAAEDGWIRGLADSGERCITKPMVYGGIGFFTSFIPNDDTCGYGGYSRLYALYYETGTAYPRAVLSETEGTDPVADSIDLGPGLSSSPAIHPGKDEDTVFVQQSTGQVVDIEFEPIFGPESGLISWEEKSE